jgi:hypothetical protein
MATGSKQTSHLKAMNKKMSKTKPRSVTQVSNINTESNTDIPVVANALPNIGIDSQSPIQRTIFVRCPFCDKFSPHLLHSKFPGEDIYYSGADCGFKNHSANKGPGRFYKLWPLTERTPKAMDKGEKEIDRRARLKAPRVKSQRSGTQGGSRHVKHES